LHLETNIQAVENERASLQAHLERQSLTPDQISSFYNFAAVVSAGLEGADQDLSLRREIVNIIDLRATLTVEEGQRVVYINSILGDNSLSFKSSLP
jgi:hypothetical protein